MQNNIQIYIPSRSRPQKQTTIQRLSQNLWPYITLVVPAPQFSLYRAFIPADISIVGIEAEGIGPTRQFILRIKGSGKFLMVDDDLTFYKRSEDGQKFFLAAPKETEEMISSMSKLLDKYPMVGLLDKFWSHTQPREYRECFRMNDMHGYNRDLFPKPWPSFRIPHDEEHDMHLQFLTRGYRTAVTTEWCKTTKADRPGGCSDWRNQEILDKAHQMLVHYWGDLVDPGPRKVRYNWKRAMQIGGLLP